MLRRYCHVASDARIFIHKSHSLCEADAFNARFTTPSAMWMCFITFDLPSLAGSASFTQHSHSMDLGSQEEVLGLQTNMRLAMGDGDPREERHTRPNER